MHLTHALASLAAIASFAFGVNTAIAHGAAGQSALQTVREAAADVAQTMTGTVNAFVVVDTTRGTSQRHVELRLDDDTFVPLRGRAVDALAQDARVEVSGHRRGKPLDVESVRTLSLVPSRDNGATAEVDGTLAILHADYFADEKSAFIYEVPDASGKVRRLRMGALPAALEPGMKVRVHGRADASDESMLPERITILARPAPTSGAKPDGPPTKAATANSVLVIMASFNNTAAPGFSAAQAQQVMVSNADSVANFFRETSYGQQVMNVTVTPGWVTMNLAQPASCGSSDWRGIGTSADAAAKTLGTAYDPAAYQFVVYVFPTVPACGWLGLAYIGFPQKSWINGVGAFRTSTIAHEMGHNFGLLHAASLRCSGVPIGGNCSSSEYGDPFDAMGNQRTMHFNAMQKSKLAWISPTSVRTHTGGSATYTLSPLEVAGAATYAVKIPTSASNRTYWLEFRQPIGFDSPLSSFPNNGAQVRVAYPFETLCSGCDTYSDDTQLLDMTPSTATFTDATLLAGQTFSDAAYGVNVTVLSATAGALTIQVGTGGAPPPPAFAPTTTTIVGTPNPSLTGATVAFTATVSGSAPTGAVRFTDNGVTIPGCSGIGLSGSGNARSASCSTNALITGTHAIAASYEGDAGNAASASATLSQAVHAPFKGTNVALASKGGVATASSIHSPGFSPDGVNDDRRSGAGWGSGGGWNDGTRSAFPDWVQIRFNGPKTIDHVVVHSLQDNYLSPAEPADSTKFTRYGLTDFEVQGFDGANWATLGTVSGNELVKRTVSFSPYTTDRIRILITGSRDALWSRVTEVEAWTSSIASTSTNFALAANGGVASSSSVHSIGYATGGLNDGRRSGAVWGSGGGWNDATPWSFPDWAQVNFSAQRTIDHVVLYSVQDNFTNPAEPTDSMTFTRFGLGAFQVQGWNGGSWITLASVSGNRFVKRTVSFLPYTTDRVRIVVTATADGIWSRITEFEAWGN